MNKTNSYEPTISGGVYGISCHFPCLQDIIDYEENIRVPNQGYPRFIPHPYVREVEAMHSKDGLRAFAVQSAEAAKHVTTKYFDKQLSSQTLIEQFTVAGNSYAIIYVPEHKAQEAKEDICNAGIILNARKAHRIINKLQQPGKAEHLSAELSKLEKGSTPQLTFPFNSGMEAIYAAVMSQMKPGKKAVVIGSCYIDSYKIFSKLPQRFTYLPTQFLNSYCGEDFDNDTSLVFLEVPSNPLLQVEDVAQIVEKAHNVGAKVIIDSTIATPHHFSPFDYATDIIAHSTSKGINGSNDHMGGVLFINPESEGCITPQSLTPFGIDNEESHTLLNNMKSFSSRIGKMSSNAAIIKEYLDNQPNVERVYYPQNLKNGGGHVVSFILKGESEQRAKQFYDNCTVPVKGPSMGYQDTMLMPYSLMTRYNDTDEELNALGLSRYLMRLSVGTEEADQIIGYLKRGFDKLT